MNIWLRILDFRQRHRVFGTAKGVASVRVLQLYNRADISGIERRHTRPCLAVQQINLTDFFRAPPVNIIKLAAELHRSRVNAKERELAELRLAHRLEDVQNRIRIIERDLDRLPI